MKTGIIFWNIGLKYIQDYRYIIIANILTYNQICKRNTRKVVEDLLIFGTVYVSK